MDRYEAARLSFMSIPPPLGVTVSSTLKDPYEIDRNQYFNKGLQGGQLVGGDLQGDDLHGLLQGSYSGDAPENWSLDHSISKDSAKVFVHNHTGQVAVAHRGTEGTMGDWSNNAVFGATGELGYKQTHRYKNSERVQRRAEEKYGAQNVSTIGHSQGGLLAQMLGGNSKEIITVNKATRPQEVFQGSSKKKNQYDVRSSTDAVSAWRMPWQSKKASNRDTTIRAKTNNPLTEHSYDILKRKDNKSYGKK